MPANLKHFIFGNACMLQAVLFWGINIPVTKALIPEWMTADSISAVRLIGGCCLFWMASFFWKGESIRKGDWLKIILGGMIGLFAFIYLFIISLRFGSAIDISIIMTLPPMFVILIGVFFLHQRPTIIEYVGIIVSFIGAVIVILGGAHSSASAPNPLLGDILAILSSICFAFYLVILEKPSKEYHPISLLRWVYLFAAIPGLFLLHGFSEVPILNCKLAIPWLQIGFILFCPTFFAYFLVQPAEKNIGSELASLYQYLVPVVAAIAAVCMGMETISWIQVIAMCVIVLGMGITTAGKKTRVKKESSGS